MDPGQPGFHRESYSGTSGEEIDIPISLGEHDELYLVVGDEQLANFEIQAVISDGSGDYDVTAVFDTDAGSSDAAWLRSDDEGDSLSVANVTNPNDIETVEPFSYDLSLYESSAMETELDTGTVSITSSG
ncbi:DUF7827 domain-containing protein [Halosimplex marinum]|uniref:DUF7827 domain-containing protein n=1 Tax=Halosimplex marinum TaxID=3396620 RepID=UPI003F57564E